MSFEFPIHGNDFFLCHLQSQSDPRDTCSEDNRTRSGTEFVAGWSLGTAVVHTCIKPVTLASLEQ